MLAISLSIGCLISISSLRGPKQNFDLPLIPKSAPFFYNLLLNKMYHTFTNLLSPKNYYLSLVPLSLSSLTSNSSVLSSQLDFSLFPSLLSKSITLSRDYCHGLLNDLPASPPIPLDSLLYTAASISSLKDKSDPIISQLKIARVFL